MNISSRDNVPRSWLPGSVVRNTLCVGSWCDNGAVIRPLSCLLRGSSGFAPRKPIRSRSSCCMDSRCTHSPLYSATSVWCSAPAAVAGALRATLTLVRCSLPPLLLPPLPSFLPLFSFFPGFATLAFDTVPAETCIQDSRPQASSDYSSSKLQLASFSLAPRYHNLARSEA